MIFEKTARLIALGALVAAPSIAQAQSPAADTVAVTPTYADQQAAKEPPPEAQPTQAEPGSLPRPKRRIHGEVGAAIGTNGYRAAYGVVEVPLGENGTAVIAVETSRFHYPH